MSNDRIIGQIKLLRGTVSQRLARAIDEKAMESKIKIQNSIGKIRERYGKLSGDTPTAK